MLYNGKIIDCHMHLCDLATDNYSWLTEDRPAQRQILGEEGYALLAKSFLPKDYEALARLENIVGTVHLQYEADDDLKETQWLTTQAQQTGTPSALIAKVNLARQDTFAQLEAQAQSPYFRGIRMLLSYLSGKPEMCLTDQDYFLNPTWQKNFGLLKTFNCHFEVQLYDTQADALIAVAQQHPDILIVVNHLLWPLDPTPQGFAFWQKQMARLARCENVFMKISGAAVIFKKFDVTELQKYIDVTLEQFTPARCVVGSNYPPDGIFASFHDIWQGYRILLEKLSESEQAQIFHDNAKRIYRLA